MSGSACPLCAPDRPAAQPVVEAQGHQYVRCTCGLVRLAVQPQANELDAVIQHEDYGYGGHLDWDATYPPEQLAQLEPYRRAEATHRRLVALLRRGGVDPAQPLRVHDIGCCEGFSLYFAKREGWRASGNDLSARRREFGRRNLQVDFTLGFFSDVTIDDLPLDVVTLRHVLEHLPDPLAELGRVHAKLRPGGALLVEVPNFASPTLGLKVARQKLGLRKGSLSFLGAPEHLWQFTHPTLRQLLARAGFAVRVATTTGRATNHAPTVNSLLEQTLHRAQLGPYLLVLATRQ